MKLTRRATRLRIQMIVIALGATLTLSGCNQRFGMPKSATEEGDSVVTLWLVSMYSAIALGVLVFGLVGYSLIRHRRRSDKLPKQIEGHNIWEITYTVLPLIAVIALFLYGLQAQDITTSLKKEPDLRVEVTAFQWNWRFTYPEQNVTVVGGLQDIHDQSTFPQLVLPVNKRSRLNLVSTDVAHSFFVPNFVTKRDLIPGVKNEIDLTPKTTGEYVGHCAEFCGVNHAQMNFLVRIVTEDEFDAWISQQRESANSTTTTTTTTTTTSEAA